MFIEVGEAVVNMNSVHAFFKHREEEDFDPCIQFQLKGGIKLITATMSDKECESCLQQLKNLMEVVSIVPDVESSSVQKPKKSA